MQPYKTMNVKETIIIKGNPFGKFRAIVNYALKTNKYFTIDFVNGGVKVTRTK